MIIWVPYLLFGECCGLKTFWGSNTHERVGARRAS